MSRRYGGLSEAERTGARRAQLITAARDLLAETGWSGVSVRAVCARSGLADRYFYAGFESRDALLIAVCDQVMVDVLAVAGERMQAAEPTYRGQVRAAADAVLDLLEREAGLVRVLLLETPDTPALNAQRRRMMGTLVDLLLATTRELDPGLGVADTDRRVRAHAILGALFELLTAWTAGELTMSREDLLDHVVRLAASIAASAAGE